MKYKTKEKKFLGLDGEQRRSLTLLSIGTCLEYFDLMLYVHMAVVLNELFFPKSDPHIAAFISAFAFCSTYIFRPIGALIFGYIGDNIGRKTAITIATMVMASSCVIMANLPTYDQIGITATWIVTICRIVQGMSSIGELIGVELYLTETLKPPTQYAAIALIESFCALGGFIALAVASLVITFGFNYRIAFWIGAGIALVSYIARTQLCETPDFIAFKAQAKKYSEVVNKTSKYNDSEGGKSNKGAAIALFFIQCAWPLCFYFVYVHCSDILKNLFNYSSEQVIHQNFVVSIAQLSGFLILIYLSYRIYPLKLLKIKAIIFLIFSLICPYLLYNISSPFQLLLMQSFCILFALNTVPAIPILYSKFPVFKRFTYTSFLYTVPRALMHVVTSFGLVYLTQNFGHWALLLIMIPTGISFILGIQYFEKLEKHSLNCYC